MKKCGYCNIPIPKKEISFWIAPMSSMDRCEPVCDRCVLETNPLDITGFIGVIDEFS